MTLFAILICIALQRYFNLGANGYLRSWSESYVQGIWAILSALRLENGYVKLGAACIPIMILISVLQYLLHGIWFELPQFILNLVVLFFCIDFRKLPNSLADYPTIFSVLFYYLILGPVGALVYVMLDCLNIAEAGKVRNILDWIPGRLVGLSYALVGHFAHGFAYWRKHAMSELNYAREFASKSGMAALELGNANATIAEISENTATSELVSNALILWIAVIAVFTLVSWVS